MRIERNAAFFLLLIVAPMARRGAPACLASQSAVALAAGPTNYCARPGAEPAEITAGGEARGRQIPSCTMLRRGSGCLDLPNSRPETGKLCIREAQISPQAWGNKPARSVFSLAGLRGGMAYSGLTTGAWNGHTPGMHGPRSRGDAGPLEKVVEELVQERDGPRSSSPPIFTWSSAEESVEGAAKPLISAREAYAKAFQLNR